MRVRMYVSCSYCTFSLPSPLPRQLQSTMGDGGGSPPADKDKVEQLPKRSVSEQEASEYQVAAWGRVIVLTSHHHPPSLLSLMYTRRHLSTLSSLTVILTVILHHCHPPSLSSGCCPLSLLSSLYSPSLSSCCRPPSLSSSVTVTCCHPPSLSSSLLSP